MANVAIIIAKVLLELEVFDEFYFVINGRQEKYSLNLLKVEDNLMVENGTSLEL